MKQPNPLTVQEIVAQAQNGRRELVEQATDIVRQSEETIKALVEGTTELVQKYSEQYSEQSQKHFEQIQSLLGINKELIEANEKNVRSLEQFNVKDISKTILLVAYEYMHLDNMFLKKYKEDFNKAHNTYIEIYRKSFNNN